jgi:chorismate synthase
MRIELNTAGDSHGVGLTMILNGMPAGLPLDEVFITTELERRRSGPGRSGRQEREKDEFELIGGVFEAKTTGAPISIFLHNRVRDDGTKRSLKEMRVPRPGHADLPGVLKYDLDDIRPVAERASARETAARVAGGAICKLFLKEIGINICSRVLAIGENTFIWEHLFPTSEEVDDNLEDFKPDETAISWGGADTIDTIITMAEQKGYNLGNALMIIAYGLLPGLGSHVDWTRRLDGRIAQAFLSVPAIKGIDIGDPDIYRLKSSEAQDQIIPDEAYPWITSRATNLAGGIEGGATNGEPLIVTARFKPIPTSDEPMNSVELKTGRGARTTPVRHDTCPVMAVAVILENMLAIVLADAALEKFGGDAMNDVLAARAHYLTRLKKSGDGNG